MTFFSVFDVPVFWPILLMYWFILFFVTMKRQIKHMIKYKYLPFTWGKKVRPSCPASQAPALRCCARARQRQRQRQQQQRQRRARAGAGAGARGLS
jgi:hypothetical protein